jgi:hypothetical protein
MLGVASMDDSLSISQEKVRILMSDFGIPWWAWIPIIAIVMGGISGILRQRHKHLERMELIRQGINPDSPKSVGRPEV